LHSLVEEGRVQTLGRDGDPVGVLVGVHQLDGVAAGAQQRAVRGNAGYSITIHFRKSPNRSAAEYPPPAGGDSMSSCVAAAAQPDP
jgi:hypothetical protein